MTVLKANTVKSTGIGVSRMPIVYKHENNICLPLPFLPYSSKKFITLIIFVDELIKLYICNYIFLDSRHWNYFFQEYGTTHLEYVVDNYYHAITARYPRLRYRCGWDALFLIPLSYLPTEIFDFITCVIFPMIIGFPCYIKNTVQKK